MVCVVGYGGVWRRGVMGSVGMGGGDWGEENRRGVCVLWFGACVCVCVCVCVRGRDGQRDRESG